VLRQAELDTEQTMPRSRRAQLDKDYYALPTRLPKELAEWLREYAFRERISQNAVLVEALESLRDRVTANGTTHQPEVVEPES
jgi:hypothetical protein